MPSIYKISSGIISWCHCSGCNEKLPLSLLLILYDLFYHHTSIDDTHKCSDQSSALYCPQMAYMVTCPPIKISTTPKIRENLFREARFWSTLEVHNFFSLIDSLKIQKISERGDFFQLDPSRIIKIHENKFWAYFILPPHCALYSRSCKFLN